MTERVAIVGSRAHPNLEIVREYVRSLPPSTVVVSGGASGVDHAAEVAAIECGLTVVSYRPADRSVIEWSFDVEATFPGKSGLRRVWRKAQTFLLPASCTKRDKLLVRNTLIALSDRMASFPDGSGGGSWDVAREAARFDRPVEIRWANGEVQPFSSSMQKRIGAQLRLDGGA